MPPKAATIGKKGAEEIDLSDIATLPKVKTAIFQIVFSKFKSAAVRERVRDHVLKSFSEDRVKTVTRQDILDYGKSKGIIEEGAGNDAPPKGNLTYQQMLAQAAADRLFELSFQVRKAKKEKLQKLEEEAALKPVSSSELTNQASGQKNETDSENVDTLIYLPDYPTTTKEALAFSQYGHSINCFFEIYQVQENMDGSAPLDFKTAKEVVQSQEPAEIQHLQRVNEQVQNLKAAISTSAKGAPIRNCATFRVPFCDAELVEFKQNEEGEQATNVLSAEQSFVRTLQLDYIEKYCAYYVFYKKFKQQVEVHQLMPETAVMQELAQLKRARHQYVLWRTDREISKKELAAQQLTDAEKEKLSQEEKQAFEANKQDSVKQIDTSLDTQKEEDLKNQERIKQLLALSKISLDEGRDKKTYFNDQIYQNDFIPNKEATNSIPALLSAIISQVALENQLNSQQSVSILEQSTEPETIDDIFQHFEREIAYDADLLERDIDEEHYVFQPIKGKLPSNYNVYETVDSSTQILQTLPAGIIEERKEHAVKIMSREREAARNLVLPGCNRYMMPDVPSKSQRLRNFENPQFYPFSTLPVEDAERTMQLKAFQQLIKSNQIDEGVKPKDRLAKNKIFERKFDEQFDSDVLRQVLQNAMLLDPDIASMYYPRSDKLLLILYNKIKNSKRSSENKEQPHNLKRWRSAYRVLPDFQTWIEFFGQNCVVQQQEYEAKDPSDPPIKFSLDDEMVPNNMLDIDDFRIKNINQTLSQFLPDDNSILTSEEYELGGVKRIKSIICKDKLTFGLREIQKDQYLNLPEQNGLINYKPVGSQQLWLNFSDKESKLVVDIVQAERNPQKLIEIKPPEPTAEEIAAKEEAARIAAAAAAKGKKGGPAVVEVVEEKEPEKVFEEGPPSYLDQFFTNEELGQASTGPCSTVTLKNGLIVRHMPNGDVVQIKDTSLTNQKSSTEVDRVYLQGGILIRHFHNLDSEVLWPNGECAVFNRNELKWTVTNSKGFRRELTGGVWRDLPKINCLNQTDSTTGTVTMVREDKVVLIQYEDGNLYCQHADGTQIFSQEDGAQTRIEKEGFAPVMYQATEIAEKLDDWLNVDELKSLDGMMTMVFLPDGCTVKTIKFFKSSQETNKQVVKHIYQRADFSCFMIDQDGDFRIISTEARSAINQEDERARIGQDIDYLKQLYQPKGRYTPGVFYGMISQTLENNHIVCRDSERPFSYKLNYVNKLEKQAYAGFQENEDWKVQEAQKPFEPERDIERIGIHRNPFIKSFLYPRIFIVSPNGEGSELLSQDQVDQIFKATAHKEDTLTTSKVEYVENTAVVTIQVMNKVTSIQETELANQKMSKLQFPEYSWPYVIKNKTEEEMNQLKPLQDQYQYRCIIEYSSFEPLKQNAFIEDYLRFNDWKLSQVRYDTEFAITHIPPKDGQLDMDEIQDNEFYAKRINFKIFNERMQGYEQSKKEPVSFKSTFKQSFMTNEEIIGFRKKMTTVEREELEIKQLMENKKKMEAQKQVELEKAREEEQRKGLREKKKIKTRQKVEERLAQYKNKKETPTFVPQYHKSRAGYEYFKAHPVKPPSDEVMMRMTQRITRSQHNTDKGQSIFDGNSQKSGRSNQQDKGQANTDKDNPIVALEPEEQLLQHSAEKSKKFTSQSRQTAEDASNQQKQAVSLFKQEKAYVHQLEQEKILKAEEHHVIKTKDFNVYGKLRQEKPFVKVIQKSQVPSELNEKFITTECITDRRVKISSMANRQYINAPSVEGVRKQGQHQMILQAIQKKQTFSELINQANSMVTSVLHDSMKRCVNILPSSCKFGVVQQGQDVEMILTVKNEDSLSQRIQIKPVSDQRISIKQEVFGPIAPGMTKRLIITILASGENSKGKIKDEIQIMTKSDIFKVPVECTIISQKEAEDVDANAQQNSRVKNKLSSVIADSRKTSVLNEFKSKQLADQQKGSQMNSKKAPNKKDPIDVDIAEAYNEDADL